MTKSKKPRAIKINPKGNARNGLCCKTNAKKPRLDIHAAVEIMFCFLFINSY